MLTIEKIREGLHDKRLDRVAEATGIHRGTISRIRNDEEANPTYAVVKRLSDYLEGGPK